MNGVFQLEKIIKDTALMADDYRCFLMNVKTNKIIGQLENDVFLYDKDETIVRDRFYFLGRKGLTSIYDAKKEEFLLQNCRRRYNNHDFYFLTDQKEKWHIFNIQNPELHALNRISLDEVDLLTTDKDFYGDVFSYYVLTQNGKKALFNVERNYLSLFLYDDIHVNNHVFIFTEGKKKLFQKVSGVHFDKEKILYDEIKIDENGFVYGIDKNGIDIYEEYPFGYNFLFHTDYYDEIQFFQKRGIDNLNYDYKILFKVKKDNYYGIIMGERPKNWMGVLKIQNLFDLVYDNIDKDEFETGFIFEKEGKKGYLNFVDENYSLPIEYDNIYIISYRYQLFAVATLDGCTNIIKFLKNGEKVHLVDDIVYLKQENGLVFYQKNHQNNLLCLESIQNNSLGNFIFEDLSDCSKVGNCYIITQKGKKGLIYPEQFMIVPSYQEIKLDFVPSGCFESNEVVFALKNDENQYFLGGSLRNPETGCIDFRIDHEKSYSSIELNHDIIILKDEKNTYLQSYYGELLMTFPRNTKVEFVSSSLGQRLYLINGSIYKYSFDEDSSSKRQSFSLANSQDIGLCVRAYKHFDELIVVNGYDDGKMERFCSKVEKNAENVFEVVKNIDQLNYSSLKDADFSVKKLSLKPQK